MGKKRTRWPRLLCGAALACVCTFGACGAVWALDVESFRLENGLQVLLVEDHRAPVVINSVWYYAGSVDEKPGKTGIAHMLEHMMFKGTPNVPAGEFSKIIARHGGQDNAFTSRDLTAYYQKIARDNLPVAVEMEADRMANLAINNTVFQPERDVVLEERRMRVENNPKQRFFEMLMKKALPTHPYGNPVIGWRQDIENYTVDDAVNWYNTHYTPNNAVLIMAGDIKKDEVEGLIRQHYGAVPVRFQPKPRENHVEPLPAAPVVVEQTDPAIQVPMYYKLFRTPSLFGGVAGHTTNNKTALSLLLLAEIVGGGDTGRLYKTLVENQQIADVALASYDPVSREETVLDIYIEPKPGVAMAAIDTAVADIIADIQHNGVTKTELNRVRTALLASRVYAQDSVFYTVYLLGQWVMAGGDVAKFDDWQQEIADITPEDIRQVAIDYLHPVASVTGILQAGAQPVQKEDLKTDRGNADTALNVE